MADELTIKEAGDFALHPLGVALNKGLRRAVDQEPDLPAFLLRMQGMSGKRYRSLINTVIGALPDARYLEIGSWAGSTCCSAIYRNAVTATCIDNWSLFGGPKDRFFANTKQCSNEHVKLSFIESDFRAVDYSQLGKFNVYMFDGPHGEADQQDGVTIAQPALDDTHILVVDDWNWPAVRKGTFSGIKLAGLDVLYSIEIRSTQNDALPQVKHEHSDWHNGYFLALAKRGTKPPQ